MTAGPPRVGPRADETGEWGALEWVGWFLGSFLVAVLAGGLAHGSAPANVVPPRQLLAAEIALPLCFIGATAFSVVRRSGRLPGDILQTRDRPVLADLAVGAAVGLGFQVAVAVLYGALGITVHQRVAEDIQRNSGALKAGLVILAAVLAPVGEELFFRVLLFDALRRRMPAVWALVLQGLAFGLIHIDSRGILPAIPALVGAGIVFGALFARGRSIACCVAAHMAFNAFAVAALLR